MSKRKDERRSVIWGLWKKIALCSCALPFLHICFFQSHFHIEIGSIWCWPTHLSKILSSCLSSISWKHWMFTFPAAVCEMTSTKILEKEIKIHFHLETGQAKSILHRTYLIDTGKLIASGFNVWNYTHSNVHLSKATLPDFIVRVAVQILKFCVPFFFQRINEKVFPN